ncbi:MAG: type II toxin-antitoxin system HicB family antitoxin [Desulfovibrio sp.]|jgi:predicted RNase H-like HicB family nuclease|nr:type II toxin-antitoxin system HicB family antitoxin [Desulfovibrio sp.]
MRKYYAAGFIPEADEAWTVYFPDFPEIHTGGGTLEEATENAADALRILLETMVRGNNAVPEPSGLASARERVKAARLLDDLPYPEDAVYQLVAAPSFDLTPVRVNVSIPRASLAVIDDKASAYGFTRSGFLTHAALAYRQED